MRWLLVLALISFCGLAHAELSMSGVAKVFEYNSILGALPEYRCSGAVVKFEGVSSSRKAWLMSNAHCYKERAEGRGIFRPLEILKPGGTRTNLWSEALRKPRAVLFDGREYKSFLLRRLIYATLDKYDIAVIEIDATYEELRHQGINAYIVSREKYHAGQLVEVLSGKYKSEYPSCHIEEEIPLLREGNYEWPEMYRLSPECQLRDGYSGSIVVDSESRQVVGLFSTWNEEGEKCTLENPCEVWSEEDRRVKEKASYGFSLHKFYYCIDKKGRFDLNQPSCELPKPRDEEGKE